MTTHLEELPPGDSGLLSARSGPDLAAAGWTEAEYVATGTAPMYTADELPADGRWSLAPGPEAEFATRVVVRRPDPAHASGTLVVEWLNVSSGADAAPDWTYLAEEVVRRGHSWAGVSAQYVGVEGGPGVVGIAGASLPALRTKERYAALHHPGDAFAYGIFTEVTIAVRDLLGDVTCLLGVGESQAAFALTSYVNGVHPLTRSFDGFLVHSRGGAALPLGEAGRAVGPDFRAGVATRIRDDLDVPVIIVQTETDLLGRLHYLPARQPDSDLVRLWEVAGTAHADRFQIGEFEDFLGCPLPVNRGQQAYVLRAALRHLDAWARTGAAAPSAARLEVLDEAFVKDANGNTRGGVRTPAVDAPVEVLSGDTEPGASLICQLFGSTLPLPAARRAELYADESAHLEAYRRGTDAAVEAGFVLADDVDEVLAEARAAWDRVTGPTKG